jgi:hypothetical protein
MSRHGLKNVPVLPVLLITLLYLYGVTIFVTSNFSQASPNPAEISYKEDFNGDGIISVKKDATALLLLGRDNPGNPVADYNGDGKYSISDVIQLLLNIRDGNLMPVIDTTAIDTTAIDTTAIDTTTIDTTGSNDTYIVQGKLYCAAGNIASIQILLLSENNMQTTASTDANGIYNFLVPNGRYTIVPIAITGYAFNPDSRSVIV